MAGKIDLSMFLDDIQQEDTSSNVETKEPILNVPNIETKNQISKTEKNKENNIKETKKDIVNQETQEEIENEKQLTINNEESKSKSSSISSDNIDNKIKNFSDNDLDEKLKNIFEEVPQNLEGCYTLINPDIKGFRAMFVGDMTGTKGQILKKLNKLLFEIGKVDKEKYVHLAFNEIEKLEQWDTQTLYVISNLSDAYINLFSKDSNEETDGETSRYARMLESLLNAPMNAYIILDISDDISKKNFIMIDPRITLIFEKKLNFPDFSNEKIAKDTINKISSLLIYNKNPIQPQQIEEYLENNRRYFPFKNNELTNYLAMVYNTTNDLPPNKENTFSLDEAFKNIIGMEDVKKQIYRMKGYLEAQKIFKEHNIDVSSARFSNHLLLTGNPGTGKTTVARIISHLYYSMGFLKVDKLIEVSGQDLMGATEAISARKTAKAIKDAMGGCLYIDEAYAFTSDAGIAVLIKAMEDNINDFAVFLTGYTKEMAVWSLRNSGIASRIGTTIRIDPYSEEELTQIFLLKLRNLGFTVVYDNDFIKKLNPLLGFAMRNKNSGNGRYIDRIIQASLLMVSMRIKNDPTYDPKIFDHECVPPISEVMKVSQ